MKRKCDLTRQAFHHLIGHLEIGVDLLYIIEILKNFSNIISNTAILIIPNLFGENFLINHLLFPIGQ